MTERAATTPMHRLFDRLRQRKKETEAEIIELQNKLEILQLLEGDLVDKHSELEPVLNFYDEEFGKAGETQESPKPKERIEEKIEVQRYKLPEAICHQFVDPGMSLTVPEIADFLEDMRRRGELDTKAERITYDRTSKVVRKLTKEKRLVKEVTKVGNRVGYVYRLAYVPEGS